MSLAATDLPELASIVTADDTPESSGAGDVTSGDVAIGSDSSLSLISSDTWSARQ
jgi:hypothetical protein